MTGGWTYTRFELLRTVRNRRFFIFSLGFPLVLYFAIAGPNRNVDDIGGSGIPAPLYFMAGLVGFGGMASMLSAGARIAAERSAGWNRQLRITPLKPFTYIRAKLVTAYALAGITFVALYASGGSISLFALLGGTWFPIPDSGVMHDIAQVLPSYWLVQASHVSIGGAGWGVTGWVVIVVWTVVLSFAAAYAYRRDTSRA
jgi:ABC-2 type transport system permease protein